MTARITARLTTSFLLLAIAFLVYLLLMAAPASAHHREDHTNGKTATADTDLTVAGDSTDGSETSGTDGGSTAAGSGSASTTADTSSGSSAGTQSSSDSTSSGNPGSLDKHTEKAAEGIEKHGFDPDPVHTPTAPATTGPLTCPDYNDGDAGPYDHENCDGTQGLHGNGGNGKCAGCTGKADDKWPGGQFSGDHNNGYECDHNGGIGKGNPAHSRCATPPPPCVDNPLTPEDECNPPTPCVDNPLTPEDECNPPTPCVDNPTTPMDECNPPPPPCVDDPDTQKDECNPPPPKPPEDDDDVEGLIVPNVDEPEDRQATKGRPTLPFTGATVGNFLWLAMLLMGAGMLLLWRVRDRGADA